MMEDVWIGVHVSWNCAVFVHGSCGSEWPRMTEREERERERERDWILRTSPGGAWERRGQGPVPAAPVLKSSPEHARKTPCTDCLEAAPHNGSLKSSC